MQERGSAAGAEAEGKKCDSHSTTLQEGKTKP
jgi:hypothetical protein